VAGDGINTGIRQNAPVGYNAPMHIGLNAHLLSGAPGYRSAGIHQYIDRLLGHLAAAAPEWRFTALVGRRNRRAYSGIEMRRSVWDTEAPLRRLLWEQFAQPWALGEFDLYHALAFAGPVILRAPMVVTVYDLSFIHYPQYLPASRRFYLRLFTGLTCRRARQVLTISESTARDVMATFGLPPERIAVTWCGHDADRYHPLPPEDIAAFKRARGLPERFWLYIGTLEPRKNLTTLFEAYAALPRSKRLPLLIGGGKGWQYDSIFATVERLGLSREVEFKGFLPTEELPLWYNSAELFVYPSLFEGFGLPVLEAMACGTPVIVSAASSLPEVAGDAGLTVPPLDVDAWRAALARAAGDADWRSEARDRGLERAACFTWARTAEQTIAAYRRAMGE